ncbi:MAG: aspartate carbamoyltransferase catalytic subunit [Bacteriovoracaceae bacterium]|nr:aspartate carbamoyltransferase catalytic subunit [Bacteriovoracaceae bacterium]
MNNFPSVLEAISDLNIDQIEGLLILARKFKERPSDSTIFTNHRPIVANSFLENSTRTKTSFAIATTKLGCRYIDFNAETSSLKKGETLHETLRTLSCQGIDLCIIRSAESFILSKFKKSPPMKLINGGDGTNQHPTQALLDLFTLLEVEPNLKGKKIAIIGDCIHSRVGNSLCELLPMFGCKVILMGPKEFLPSFPPNQHVTLSTDLDKEMGSIDFLYTLRIQNERHTNSGSMLIDNYSKDFGITLKRMNKHGLNIPIFHPGPVNIGIEIDQEIINSPYYMGYEQVKNSIFMRMAIITTMLQNNDKSVGSFNENRLQSKL